MKKTLYYADFVMCPSAALLCMIMQLDRNATMGGMMVTFAAGWVLWTFCEYWIHRAVHVMPFMRYAHAIHHEWPSAFESQPPLVTAIAFGIIFGILCLIFGTLIACGVECGALGGYTFYICLHNRMHRGSIPSTGWLSKRTEIHLDHHESWDYDFGVSTGFWDHMFNTEKP